MDIFNRLNMRTTVCSLVILALLGAMAPVAAAEEEPAPAPKSIITGFSAGVSYTAVSEYIWRGQNFSDYPGEGREKLNHQIDIGATVETELGDVYAGVWFECFNGQTEMDADSNCCLQEVDYYFGYSNSYKAIGYGVMWTYFEFPHVSGDAKTTNEINFSLEIDDSAIFGTESSILTPTVSWNVDLDQNKNNSWVELGVSHEFAIPGLEALTITPSLTLGIDGQFTDSTKTRLGNLLYGIEAGYELPLGFSVAAFLNFSQALEADDVLDDELFGGVTVGYSF